MAFPIGAAVAVVGKIGGIFGGGSKDPGRLRSNEIAYQAALQGDATALAYLKQRSGQYGVAETGWREEPGPVGGWASQATQDDAMAKYLEVVARQKLGGVAEKIGGVAYNMGDAANVAAGRLDPQRNSSALLYIALIVVGVIVLIRVLR